MLQINVTLQQAAVVGDVFNLVPVLVVRVRVLLCLHRHAPNSPVESVVQDVQEQQPTVTKLNV